MSMAGQSSSPATILRSTAICSSSPLPKAPLQTSGRFSPSWQQSSSPTPLRVVPTTQHHQRSNSYSRRRWPRPISMQPCSACRYPSPRPWRCGNGPAPHTRLAADLDPDPHRRQALHDLVDKRTADGRAAGVAPPAARGAEERRRGVSTTVEIKDKYLARLYAEAYARFEEGYLPRPSATRQPTRLPLNRPHLDRGEGVGRGPCSPLGGQAQQPKEPRNA